MSSEGKEGKSRGIVGVLRGLMGSQQPWRGPPGGLFAGLWMQPSLKVRLRAKLVAAATL